jgi:hypothetical protein
MPIHSARKTGSSGCSQLELHGTTSLCCRSLRADFCSAVVHQHDRLRRSTLGRGKIETVAALFLLCFCCSDAAEPLSEGAGVTSDKAPPVSGILFGVAAATISSGAVDRRAASNRGDAGKVKLRSHRQQPYVIERSVGSHVRTRPSKPMD